MAALDAEKFLAENEGDDEPEPEKKTIPVLQMFFNLDDRSIDLLARVENPDMSIVMIPSGFKYHATNIIIDVSVIWLHYHYFAT